MLWVRPAYCCEAFPTEHGLYALSLPPYTIGPSQATPSLLIGVVQYYHHAHICGGQLATPGYDGMPTSLFIVLTQIHYLGGGSVADKPRTSQCSSVSVADITDCATSPAGIYTHGVRGDGIFTHDAHRVDIFTHDAHIDGSFTHGARRDGSFTHCVHRDGIFTHGVHRDGI